MNIMSPADTAAASSQAQANRANSVASKLENFKGNKEDVRKAAEEFESVFISQMLGHMFKDIGTDPMFGGGQAEGIYRDLLVDEYGKTMTRAGGIGIADTIERQLLALQEAN